jgi:hypothetical protein
VNFTLKKRISEEANSSPAEHALPFPEKVQSRGLRGRHHALCQHASLLATPGVLDTGLLLDAGDSDAGAVQAAHDHPLPLPQVSTSNGFIQLVDFP